MVAASSDFVNNSFNALPTNIFPTTNPSHQSEEGVWKQILSESCSKGNNTQQGSNVIFLGDNMSGKSSLLRRLEKSEAEQHGSALEYHVLSVQNDARDASYAYQLGTAGGGLGPAETLSLPIWILDGDEIFGNLLQFAIPLSPLKTVCLLVASMDNPNLIHSLKRWANVCTQQAQHKFTKDAIQDARKIQERQWKEYVDPIESSMTASVVGGFNDEPNLLPLEQGVLTDNCGVTFIVVITKSDLVPELSETQYVKSLVQVRRLCLQLGASLVYTSAKEMKNVQTLHKLILHKAFGFPFTNPAQMIERDAIFVPAGWDGEKKIDIIKETLPDADVALEPTRDKVKPSLQREVFVEAEDEQQFLARLAAAEANAPAAQKKTLAQDDTSDKDSPLANFFSNLLKDKPTGKPIPPPSADTALQLDRILKNSASAKKEDS